MHVSDLCGTLQLTFQPYSTEDFWCRRSEPVIAFYSNLLNLIKDALYTLLHRTIEPSTFYRSALTSTQGLPRRLQHCITSGTVAAEQCLYAYVDLPQTGATPCMSACKASHSLIIRAVSRQWRRFPQTLKLKPEDDIKIGIINGALGQAKVVQISPQIILDCQHWHKSQSSVQLYLVLAMPRPKVWDDSIVTPYMHSSSQPESTSLRTTNICTNNQNRVAL